MCEGHLFRKAIKPNNLSSKTIQNLFQSFSVTLNKHLRAQQHHLIGCLDFSIKSLNAKANSYQINI